MRDVVEMTPGGDRASSGLEPLWRNVVGHALRRIRLERAATQTQTAARAGISPQYLSEVERGLKEPSSEMLAAILGALRVTLADLTAQVVLDLRATEAFDRRSATAHPFQGSDRGVMLLAA